MPEKERTGKCMANADDGHVLIFKHKANARHNPDNLMHMLTAKQHAPLGGSVRLKSGRTTYTAAGMHACFSWHRS
jgi:hypothetical protein